MVCALDANVHNDVFRNLVKEGRRYARPPSVTLGQWNCCALRCCLCLTPYTTAVMDMARMILNWEGTLRLTLLIKGGKAKLDELQREEGARLRTDEDQSWRRSADMHVGVSDSWNKVEMRLMCWSSSGRTSIDITRVPALFADEAHDRNAAIQMMLIDVLQPDERFGTSIVDHFNIGVYTASGMGEDAVLQWAKQNLSEILTL